MNVRNPGLVLTRGIIFPDGEARAAIASQAAHQPLQVTQRWRELDILAESNLGFNLEIRHPRSHDYRSLMPKIALLCYTCQKKVMVLVKEDHYTVASCMDCNVEEELAGGYFFQASLLEDNLGERATQSLETWLSFYLPPLETCMLLEDFSQRVHEIYKNTALEYKARGRRVKKADRDFYSLDRG